MPSDRKAYMAAYRKANRERIKLLQAAWRESNRQLRRDYAATSRRRNPESHKAYNAAWQKANPEKTKAHREIKREVRNGRVTRQPCVECGNSVVHAHHENYDRPLDVTWLCPIHHTLRHRKQIYAK